MQWAPPLCTVPFMNKHPQQETKVINKDLYMTEDPSWVELHIFNQGEHWCTPSGDLYLLRDLSHQDIVDLSTFLRANATEFHSASRSHAVTREAFLAMAYGMPSSASPFKFVDDPQAWLAQTPLMLSLNFITT